MAEKKFLDSTGLGTLWEKIKSTFAAKTHSHGNITSDGKITETGVALAANDSIVIVDSSDSSKVKKSSIAFDGKTATVFLSKKGTWESKVASAGTADSATKATQDGDGNVITTTYTTNENFGTWVNLVSEAWEGLDEGKADINHNHDGVYLKSFTETDPVFSASAASGITSTDITNWNNKTSNTGTVTSVAVKMNGTTKGTITTSGEIDLGTVLTSHQSLASYLKIDGSNGTAAGVSALINKLTTETTKPVDDDYFIAQHSSGGTTTTTYHRKKASSIWSYISDKISSELGLTAYNYGGFAATADIANEAGHATTADKANCDGDGKSISGNYSKNTHTHSTTLDVVASQTSSITLEPGGKYSLGTGGTSLVFTMPSDNYVWHQNGINGNTVGDKNFIQMTNDANMPTASKWWHIINCVWNGNDVSWPSQFAIPTNDGDGHCYFRHSNGTTKFGSGWKKIANSTDLAAYLPLSGGTMTGAGPIVIPTETSAFGGKSIVWKSGATTTGILGATPLGIGLYSASELYFRAGTTSGSTEGFKLTTTEISPGTTAKISIGTSSKKFKSSYVSESANIGGCTQTYNVTTQALEFSF